MWTLSRSLKLRLAFAAAVLGAATMLSALALYLGMAEVGARLETAVSAEKRMARYATLSTQVSTFLVIATEAVQTGLPAEARAARIAPVASNIEDAFVRLDADIETAVAEAQALGLDVQSRYATQSLGLARMRALLQSTQEGLARETEDRARLRAHLDTFSSGFDPLLAQAVNTEALFRNETLAGIEALRQRLTRLSIAIAFGAFALVLLFYFGLIRPQFARLDRLREAARQIRQADFDLSLPETRGDEIGAIYRETNRMAAALSKREAEVQDEWTRLNETIDDRTEALRSANARLESVDENRRRFFADVSHELRTPLTVILMEAQIGKQGSGPEAEAFATIEARAARLGRRIDDLLRVARSDNGQLALDPAPTNLRNLVDLTVQEIQAEMHNAGMALTRDEMPRLMLLCDPNWTRQILASLIRNAIRHARQGRSLHLTWDDDAVVLLDNGPGIPPSAQATLFDRFTQSGNARSQGFGIGLALAKWVTEAQGGRISVTSPVPRDEAIGEASGTKIGLRLPRVSG
ncbi:ATP-binding protein [Tropicibacter sp. S64]|uniref:sensor histidine kinase n=1 Tax=Tropicibacter sp. S64 TaxID=3415122 RepID=UPI003C7BA735